VSKKIEGHAQTSADALASIVLTGWLCARYRYGIDAKLFDWSDEITADCPRKQAKNLNDQCGAKCPDLSKVV
jgi:hypothetical protein